MNMKEGQETVSDIENFFLWEKENSIDSQYYKENDTELNKYITGNQ